jgi:antitoxin VapB
MPLSIKTAEADQLARSLARLTGETMTQAVTTALRERLERERVRRSPDVDYVERITALAERLRVDYDTRPVTRAEWDAACGDEG